MNYETKILLNHLIDVINDKTIDWLIFIITTFSSLTSFAISILLWKSNKLLGKQQNELYKRQNVLIEQQNKLERFTVYQDLYETIYDIYNMSDNLLSNVLFFIQGLDFNSMDNINTKIEEIRERLSSNTVELKSKLIDLDTYKFYDLLGVASHIIYCVNAIVEKRDSAIFQLYNDYKCTDTVLNDSYREKYYFDEIKTSCELHKLNFCDIEGALMALIDKKYDIFIKDNIIEKIIEECRIN